MAEEGSGQDQASQAGGSFVSLDQAKDIALDHARDNREIYGRRWRKKPLALLVQSADERADAYYIQLSYQPAQAFSGEPGVEAFTISKTGQVQSRSIISQPQGKGGIPGCGLVAALGLFLALIVATMAPSAL